MRFVRPMLVDGVPGRTPRSGHRGPVVTIVARDVP
jgi:hypothetical protein